MCASNCRVVSRISAAISSGEVDRVVLRTIYEALMPESSHFNSNEHRGIRVSPRMIVRVNVARANGASEGSDRTVGC
jgi:hypothetical protein